MNKLKISQVQFQASHIPALNAKIIKKSFNNTLKFKPHLICTPECSNIITNDKNYLILNAPLYLASMGLIFFSIGGIFANLFSNSLIKLFTEKVVGCHFVMIGASIMFLSLLTNNFYIILAVLSLYGFAIANLVPIVIRQAVKQSSESIPMTVTNLITIGLSSTMIMPAAIGFLAETFSLTLNMYLLCIIVFSSGVVFLVKFK